MGKRRDQHNGELYRINVDAHRLQLTNDPSTIHRWSLTARALLITGGGMNTIMRSTDGSGKTALTLH
jgi:hypothetical protein